MVIFELILNSVIIAVDHRRDVSVICVDGGIVFSRTTFQDLDEVAHHFSRSRFVRFHCMLDGRCLGASESFRINFVALLNPSSCPQELHQDLPWAREGAHRHRLGIARIAYGLRTYTGYIAIHHRRLLGV